MVIVLDGITFLKIFISSSVNVSEILSIDSLEYMIFLQLILDIDSFSFSELQRSYFQIIFLTGFSCGIVTSRGAMIVLWSVPPIGGVIKVSWNFPGESVIAKSMHDLDYDSRLLRAKYLPVSNSDQYF